MSRMSDIHAAASEIDTTDADAVQNARRFTSGRALRAGRRTIRRYGRANNRAPVIHSLRWCTSDRRRNFHHALRRPYRDSRRRRTPRNRINGRRMLSLRMPTRCRMRPRVPRVSAGRVTVDEMRRTKRARSRRVIKVQTRLSDPEHRERLRVRMSHACAECMAPAGKPCRRACRLSLAD